MKKISLIILVCFCILAAPVLAKKFVFPRPQGYVSDYADVLDRKTRLRIENLGRELERKTGAEIAVVIVKTTLPYDRLEYANRLFANWHIGKEGQDNGVLLLLSMRERKVRIETGYGIEEIIPEKKAEEILSKYLLPKFREDKYQEGLYNGALGIAKAIGANYGVKISGVYYPVQQIEENTIELMQILIILLVLLLAMIIKFGAWPKIFIKIQHIYPNSFGSFGGSLGEFF